MNDIMTCKKLLLDILRKHLQITFSGAQSSSLINNVKSVWKQLVFQLSRYDREFFNSV